MIDEKGTQLKETLVVPVTNLYLETDTRLRDGKNNLPLPHQIWRPRLTDRTAKKNHATEDKSHGTKGTEFRDKSRNYWHLPECVEITSLRQELRESMQLGCVSQDSHPRKSVLRNENWDRITPSNSPWARGTKKKYGRERVHPEGSFISVSLIFQIQVHDWNYRSLLLNTVHLLSNDSILPPSSPRRLSFLSGSWLLLLSQRSRSGLWSFEFSSTDPFEVLQLSSILNSSVAHWFVQFLGRTKPIQSDAAQNPALLTCIILPGPFLLVFRLLTKELDAIVHRNPGRRRSVDVFWTDLTILVLLHKLRLDENARRSQKNRSSTFTFLRKSTCLSRSFFNADAIIVSSIS